MPASYVNSYKLAYDSIRECVLEELEEIVARAKQSERDPTFGQGGNQAFWDSIRGTNQAKIDALEVRRLGDLSSNALGDIIRRTVARGDQSRAEVMIYARASRHRLERLGQAIETGSSDL